MGILYGYARVSTREQNLNRQIDALARFGVGKQHLYTDKASGKNFNRPAYQHLLKRLKPSDVLVVQSIDRLGRNYAEIIEQWRIITKEKHAAIVVLDMPLLDTRENQNGITGVFLADLVLQILSYVAQVEREHIHQRQAEGIAAAKARGVRFGRPAIEQPRTFYALAQAYEQGTISRKDAARTLGVSTGTFDNWRRNRTPCSPCPPCDLT